MRKILQGLLFASFAAVVPKAAAEPRVAMLLDQRYLCGGCSMALNHGVYRDIVKSMYPNLEQINLVEGQLVDALTRNDALFIPLMNADNLAAALTEQQVAALRTFVRNGGRIIQRLIYDGYADLPQKFLNRVFETPLFQGVAATPAPNFTCDAAQAAIFGWSVVPAAGRAPFYGAAINGSVPGFSNICAFAANPNAITVAGFVYGEGVVYVDGIFNGSPGDWSEEQKTMTRQMVESDLLGPHRCFLKDGAVKCAGGNRVGQLGAGDAESRALPLHDLPIVDLGQGFSVARIGMTTGTTCALSTSGHLKCWGFNKSGQLARGDALPRGQNPADMGEGMPVVDLGQLTVKDFVVGRNHVCAITSDDQARCWGAGGSGRLGNESTANVGDTPESHPGVVMLPNGVKPARVVAGRNHSCVLSTMGQVYCFGENVRGQAGAGSPAPVGDRAGTMGEALRAVDLGSNFKVAQLASGLDHNCALSDQGKVKCWGANPSGELGQSAGYATRGAAPQEMGEALPFTDLGEDQIATSLQCGFAHCCALTLQKTMKCWGANDSGQLGLGDVLSRGKGQADMGDSLPFVRLPVGEPVTGMELVGNTTCATTPSGTRCWGQNGAGQLADGKKVDLGGKPDSVPRLLTPIAW